MKDRLGRYGVWRTWTQVTPALAAHVEKLGFGTLWLGGSPAGDLGAVDPLLAATSTLTVATGIVNVWASDSHGTAQAYQRVAAAYPGRFVLGVGIGHREATEEYASPYETLRAYVDDLLAGGVRREDLVLAALGPRVLRLAAERTAGAHPYLVTPEHTRRARALLGPDRVLAPEQKVVLDGDPGRARALARERVEPYLRMSNYTANLRRIGWSDEAVSPPGSEALMDALVAHGAGEAVPARLAEHFAAGADHVAVQLLMPTDADPFLGYRTLAETLEL
ncbi:LLM class F420-dependent oxidoreductase [Rhizomonospora bruguierae]|uniref:LLM class F420-dependent oxidoreductase n=1 Tax=Rhizomonospora bruguierae TaxID=1581705 RepID=UPI001BCF85C2|nr:LLM class F420-dependent oxidoreductase [Micromonospora sp. NBRC 107566]